MAAKVPRIEIVVSVMNWSIIVAPPFFACAKIIAWMDQKTEEMASNGEHGSKFWGISLDSKLKDSSRPTGLNTQNTLTLNDSDLSVETGYAEK